MADRKPKAKGVPPSKAAPPVREKPQAERFIEAAQEAGITEESFERAVQKIAPVRRSAAREEPKK